MRREPDFFGERELELVYIAKRLKDALRLEKALTEHGLDYLVETDKYRGGIMFISERIGAFFYVEAGSATAVRSFMQQNGFEPWNTE